MKVGYLLCLGEGADFQSELKRIADLGFDTIQLGFRDKRCLEEPGYVEMVDSAIRRLGITVTQIRARFYGPVIWNLRDGPATLGLVPADYRANRINDMLAWSQVAHKLGVPVISSHLGFIPPDFRHPDYQGTVVALKYICGEIKKRGQKFLIETGQEHPIVILRIFEELLPEVDNLFINYDPANLLMYGNANPIDALGMLGKFVREVHAKDGEYPVNSVDLGKERPIGEGSVDFPRFLKTLRTFGFDGVLCIENELGGITSTAANGEEHYKEIVRSKNYLESLIHTLSL